MPHLAEHALDACERIPHAVESGLSDTGLPSAMHSGSVNLTVEVTESGGGHIASSDEVILFHRGILRHPEDSSLTISTLGDGTIRVVHRCDGNAFELRGSTIQQSHEAAVTYAWGVDGCSLTIDGIIADFSPAVLSLAAGAAIQKNQPTPLEQGRGGITHAPTLLSM